MAYYSTSRDFYKILRVPHTASLDDIKIAYRKLALRLHPDMHKNDPAKTKEFRLVSEAYATLSDVHKKSSYDYEIGNRYHHHHHHYGASGNRRTAPPPPNYRKVYTARPPPHWKRVWDHQKHYDMHYGNGLQEEALKQARKEALEEGAFDYHSPLGPGFTFSDNKEENFNPYAKYAVQGPRTVTFDYQESYMDANSNRESLRKRERVVEDLHGRREARHMHFQQQQESLRRQQQRYNSAFARRSDNECVIL